MTNPPIKILGHTTADPDADLRFRTISAPALSRQTAMIAARFQETLDANPWIPNRSALPLGPVIDRYREIYDARPVRDNAGGSKFESGLWIFIIGQLLQPRVIIESGTHKGHSAWLWRQAAPAADISTFDVSHDHLEHRVDDVVYTEQDWMAAPLGIDDTENTLVFFDDHISHARRIMEAVDRGAKWVMLDDNFASYQIHATGTPPVPTGAMIFEEELGDGEDIRWVRNGKSYSHIYSADLAEKVRGYVINYTRLPSAFDITRYRPHANMTLLELKV